MLSIRKMLHERKALHDLLDEKTEENEKLKNELAELRVIAGYKIETEDSKLRPCDGVTCVACIYAHRYCDQNGGYAMLCTKDSKCKDFTPVQKGL